MNDRFERMIDQVLKYNLRPRERRRRSRSNRQRKKATPKMKAIREIQG